MNDRRIHRLIPALAATCLTVACGSVLQLAGIEGTGDSTGSASGYGSLFVNGRAFATDTAEFTLNGATVTEADIRIGMQTRIEGDLLAPRADRVIAQRSLLAPIDGIARVGAVKAATLSMLGQNVRVDEMTRLVGTNLDSLHSDMLVDVHAVVSSEGDLLATYLTVLQSAYVPGSQSLLVTGYVDSLDADALDIGSLRVDLTAVSDSDTLSVGDRVVIRGSQPSRGGDLIATSVRLDQRMPQPGSYADRTVLVDAVDGSTLRAGQTSIALGSAERLDSSAAPIEAGTLLIARGPVDASGLLVAADVEVLPAPDVVLKGQALRQAGLLRVLDQTVATRPVTQMLESRAGMPRQFAAASIQTGDALTIIGYRTPTGELVATRIERQDQLDEASVYGELSELVTAAEANRMRIGGVQVVTDSETVYESVAGTEIPEAVFEATATAGLTTQAWGVEDQSAGVLRADRIRLLNSEEDLTAQ
ncbi:MAG: DUF5666 domain-containing protein [Pseudomonadota bacterium]|nr:DUF5666 domain-containing protein [Pseudomonadota bacterium]